MKYTIGRISLLAASISLGLMLGTAPTKSALAGSFDKNIVANGQTLGSLKFTWDDANVTNNALDSFSDLTSLNYTDSFGKSFDLRFASRAILKKFSYNLSSGDFFVFAYKTKPTTIGFLASSTFNQVIRDMSATTPTSAKTPTNPSTPEAISESSSVVGLLVIAGLGLGISRKKSSK